MPTIDELYEALKPMRARQILWNACQHIDVFARGMRPATAGDVLAIGILRSALNRMMDEPEDEYERRQRG